MSEQEGEREANSGGEIATEEQHLEEEQKKKKRFRWRRHGHDGVGVEVPLPFGLSLNGASVIGFIIVLVVGLTLYLLWPKSEVPNLIGIPRAIAEVQLEDAGLNLRAIYDEASDQPVGIVLRSEPTVGTKLDRGAGVSLFIAAARPTPSPQPMPPPWPQPVLIPVPGNSAPAPGYPPPPPNNIFLPSPNNIFVLPPNGPPPTTNPNPTPTTNPPPMVSLGPGRVKHPDPTYHDCSTGYRFNFSQKVSMTQPGRVTYRWLRSDQASAPVNQTSAPRGQAGVPGEYFVDFSNPGTQIVTTWWQVSGQPGDQLTGWQQIEILTPTHLTGQRISFSYTCPRVSDERENSGLGG
jgi:PASTA domain